MSNEIQQVTDNSQDLIIAKMQATLDAHDKQITLLTHLITGNGTPSQGLSQQVALLNQTVSDMKGDVADVKQLLMAQNQQHEEEKKQASADWKALLFPIAQSLVSAIIGAGIALYLAGIAQK